ncbi:hypothetical protein [Candidatus Odyssella acanthamoebae]|uniref:Uncharacterized protein n=1 Tax=Candidatus Odyssella acanthamoebae TaxID=91604 RepID=A0A077AU55_9PROT|nr:hypothetical protein [Candidatus Paracaedibacter acanthamoebae]AIK95911.1 hypothetical protein ID47_02935 [Candidatus Paracaedibacter acanthamoebae]
MADTLYQQRTLGLRVPNLPQSYAPEQLAGAVQQNALKMANEMTSTADEIYNADFEIASRRLISEIFSKNPNNPDALRKGFDAALKGLTKDTSPDQQLELGMRFEMLAMPHISKAAENRIFLNNEKLKEDNLTLIDLSLNDMEHAAADMLSNNAVTAFDASRRVQNSMLTLQKSLNMENEGMPLFSAEKKVRLQRQAKQSLMFDGTLRWLEQQPDKAKAWQAIKDGKKTFKLYDAQGKLETELKPLTDMSLHNFDKIESFVESATAISKEQLQIAAGIEKIGSALNGDTYLDPESAFDKKAIDNYFVQKVMPTLEGMDPIHRGQAISDYVDKVGILPETVKSNIRATIRAGTPEEQVYAAELIRTIGDNSFKALEDIGDKWQTYAMNLSDLTRGGVSAEQAVKMVDMSFDPAEKTVRDKRMKELKNIPFDAEYILNAFFSADAPFKLIGKSAPIIDVPNIKEGIIADTERFFQEAYVYTGDINVAKEMARQRAKSVFGISQVTGQANVVRYPPEKAAAYNIPGLKDQSWIRRQLLEGVKAVKPDLNNEDIYITTDNQTIAEWESGRPTYPILYRTTSGSFDTLRDQKTGVTLRFAPDTAPVVKALNEDIKRKEQTRIKNAAEVKEYQEAMRGFVSEDSPYAAGDSIIGVALGTATGAIKDKIIKASEFAAKKRAETPNPNYEAVFKDLKRGDLD